MSSIALYNLTGTACDCTVSNQLRFGSNKAERGFGLLAQAAKPSETQVVH